ncbi:hypothetical protein Q0F98_21430 [Paenibacillus amylolyticus]|nr:hypothetical protein Q0F98_21430 [Paenibacillus amylolyticus]
MAKCEFTLSDQIVFDSFEHNKSIGGFILIDRVTNMTSACGVIDQALKGESRFATLDTGITRDVCAQQKGQSPLTLWFAGSDTVALAKEVEKRLMSSGYHTMLLESVSGETLRGTAEMAKVLNDAGLISLVSHDSISAGELETAREIIGG